MKEIDYRLSRLFKVYNGVTDTKVNREVFEETIKSGLVIDPDHLLTYFDRVPNGSEISGGEKALEQLENLNNKNNAIYYQKDESTSIKVLVKHILLKFTALGEKYSKSFQLIDSDGNKVTNIIPYNYYKNYYIYHIYRSTDGLEIPYGVGNWVLDNASGVLTFYGDLPEGVNQENPPLITCFQYTGGTGFRKDSVGLEGITLPIQNFLIEPNTFTTKGTETNLLASIKTLTNKIEDNFINTYGWDGDDNNEGVALGYEKIIPLRYSHSKDDVKGYDLSSDASIGATISRKYFKPTKVNKIIQQYSDTPMPTKLDYPTYNTYNLEYSLKDNTKLALADIETTLPQYITEMGKENKSDYVLKITLTDFILPQTLTLVEGNNELNDLISTWKKVLNALSSVDHKILLDLTNCTYYGNITSLEKEIISSDFENFSKINTNIIGLILPTITNEIKENGINLTNLTYLDYTNVKQFGKNSISGKFETFILTNDSILSSEGIFNTPNLKTLFINSSTPLSFSETNSVYKLFNTIPSTLESIYIYDSVYNLYNTDSKWSLLSEKNYLTKLSTNTKYPLIAGGEEVETTESPWVGLVDYVNESANSENKVLTLFIKGDNKERKVYFTIDKLSSNVETWNPDKTKKVLLTCSNITLTIDLTNISDNYKVSFEIIEGDPYVALFYWSTKEQKYLPFITKTEDRYDFGFPVVTEIGKIPPSLEFLSDDILSFGKDELTPDYYGPRLFQKVLASAGTSQNLSADYLVQSKDLYYLDEILQQIYDEDSNFEGTIFLRQGTYALKNSKSLVLPPFKNLKLIGEDKTLVNIIVTTFNASNVTGNLTIQGINFGPDCEFVLNTNNLIATTISDITTKNISLVTNNQTKIFLRDLYLNKLQIDSSVKINKDALNDGTFNIRLLNIYTSELVLNCDNVIAIGMNSLKAEFNGGKTLVTGSSFLLVDAKTTGTQIEGSDVREYNSLINENEIPTDANFKMWVKLANGQIYQRYTRFTNPFYWDREKRQIEILLDDEVLHIDDKGRITTNLTADKIAITPTDYSRDDTAIDPTTGKKIEVTADTLKKALQDLYKTKADLVNSKIPLKQLPDSVAYGGLQYVGTWSFDDHSGNYPTFNDITLKLSVDEQITTLQNGWFFIVNPPETELSKSKSDDTYNPAREQTAIDNQVFTAGDWVVYSGKKLINGVETPVWEKVDRAYQDAAYAILPQLDPDGKNWDWRNGGDGFLKFGGKTITEAFDVINEFFKYIIPRRGLTIQSNEVNLKLDREINKRKVYKISTSGIGEEVELSLPSDNKDFKHAVHFSNTENTIDHWKNWIYFSDYATLNGYFNDTLLFSNKITKEDKGKNFVGANYIIKVDDIHKDENSGLDLWSGFKANLFNNEELIKAGNYKFKLEVLDNPSFEDTTGYKEISYSFNDEPYDLSEMTLGDINLPNILSYANVYYLSGKMFVLTPFTGTYEVNFLKFAKDYLKDNDFVEVELDKNSILNSIIKNIYVDNSDKSFYDLKTTIGFNINVTNDIIEQFGINNIKIYGFKEELSKNFVNPTSLGLYTLTDKVFKENRVCSGDPSKLYPIIDTKDENGCGAIWNTQRDLITSYIGELQNYVRKVGTQIYQDYGWPIGTVFNKSYSEVKKLAYDNANGVAVENTIGSYRWVTFNTFNDKVVKLDSNNGFMLSFDIYDDYLQTWKDAFDINNHSIKGLILQIKLVSADNETPWFNANLPYDGYSVIEKEGDQVLYAGDSTYNERRITFGKSAYSGQLYVRVGIEKSSNLRFKGININYIV